MQKLRTACIILLSLLGSRTHATTWDEPWADKVISTASSFVLARVDSCDPAKGVSIEIIKTLGGKELTGALTVNGFYLLRLCSNTDGEGPEFNVSPIDSCYFFLYQNEKGQYCIATPTTGFDYCYHGKVAATYRHSYHQAAVPVNVYERTMTAIFNHYHGLPYDQEYIMGFVRENLGKKPAELNDRESDLFFLQHAALECIHHLRLPVDENLVYPFLEDTLNFHNQVSAARALAAFDTDKCKSALLAVIEDSTRRNFVKVMCIWTLAEFHPVALKSRLVTMSASASTDEDDFGGNIMDPRVCTHIPTVKEALDELLGKL
jgi:hypothetical protein